MKNNVRSILDEVNFGKQRRTSLLVMFFEAAALKPLYAKFVTCQNAKRKSIGRERMPDELVEFECNEIRKYRNITYLTSTTEFRPATLALEEI